MVIFLWKTGNLYEVNELIEIRAKELEADTMGINLIKDRIKKVGVPQGAPTSCSLSTLALRWLERLHPGKLLFYADDIILFPEHADSHPPDVLNNPKYGIICNEEKSRWSKRNGVWLVDSIKFLGLRYYPKTEDVNFHKDLISKLLPLMTVDITLIGFPLHSLIWSFIVYHQSRIRHKAVLRADTRNGASLEFSNRESFIAYLNNARTILINSSANELLGGQAFIEFLTSRFDRWSKVQNPTKLFSDKQFRDWYGTKPLKEGERRFYPHISLTGYFYARMMNNAWDLFVEQDFKLRPAKQSWVWRYKGIYSRDNNLTSKEFTTFTASSFACDALLNFNPNTKRKLIRRVPT
jgi:hypothetical protein